MRKDIDLEDPTFLLNQVCCFFTQREAEVDHETVQSKTDLFRGCAVRVLEGVIMMQDRVFGKMSNTMFVHKVVEACRNLQHERELMGGTMGSMYVRNAIALIRRSNTSMKQACRKKNVLGL